MKTYFNAVCPYEIYRMNNPKKLMFKLFVDTNNLNINNLLKYNKKN